MLALKILGDFLPFFHHEPSGKKTRNYQKKLAVITNPGRDNREFFMHKKGFIDGIRKIL